MESGWSGPSKMPFSRENNSVEKTHGENLLETAPRGGAVRCTRCDNARSRLFFRGAGLQLHWEAALCLSGFCVAVVLPWRDTLFLSGIVPRTAVLLIF